MAGLLSSSSLSCECLLRVHHVSSERKAAGCGEWVIERSSPHHARPSFPLIANVSGD